MILRSSITIFVFDHFRFALSDVCVTFMSRFSPKSFCRAPFASGFAEGWFLKGWFWQMFRNFDLGVQNVWGEENVPENSSSRKFLDPSKELLVGSVVHSFTGKTGQ